MQRGVWTLALVLVCVAAIQQDDLNYIGENLDVKISVHNDLRKTDLAKHRFGLTLTNTGSKTIRSDNWAIYFCSFFAIEPGNLVSPAGYVLPNYNVRFNHIDGCLFSMAPTPDFLDIPANGSRFVEFFGQWWAVARTDVPPNWFVAAPSLTPVNIKSTATGKKFVTEFKTVDQWKRYLVDQYNPFTAQDRFRRYKVRNFNTHTKLVIPTPKEIDVISEKFINIKDKNVVCTQDANQGCLLLKEKLGLSYTINNDVAQIQEQNGIRVWMNSSLGINQGLYHLYTDSTKKTVTVIGQSPVAIYHGIQSLLSLVSGSPDNDSVLDVRIEDEPRFEHRGMHVDVSRNFRTKEDLLRLMEAMSMYKMNKLHLHLTDDEGWRLEIPGIPELTEIGSKRCHDPDETKCLVPQLGSGGDQTTSGSGFFTVADFQEILDEASKRFIDVIPEVDIPGHSRAAIKSMEARYKKYETSDPTRANQYRLADPDDTSKYQSVQMFDDNAINPCIETTYAFVEKVISEIKKMYEGHQTLKFFHFGGDEVPELALVNSTKCQQFTKDNPFYNTTHRLKEYFVLRVSNITKSLGLDLAGWEDGLLQEGGVPFERTELPNSEVYGNAWQNIWEWGAGRRAYDLANSGYKVVLSHATHLFFDQPQEPDPEEPGLYWATRFTDAMKAFHFLPDRLYDNIAEKRSGERLTKSEACGENMEKCPPLVNKNNIIGLQGQSWGETFMTSAIFDSMVFPRILSLAERAWHKASWEEMEQPGRGVAALEDWESFANTVGHKEFKRLRQLGINYRIAPPGAIVENGYLRVNTEFPGHSVQYSRDDGATWSDIPHEWFLRDKQPFLLRSCLLDETRCSRTIKFYPDEPAPKSEQHLVDYISENVETRYEVISNLINEWQNFSARISLYNKGERDLSYGNWEIYFNSIRLIQPNDYPYPSGYLLPECNMKVHHVSGSLFKLTPTDNFRLNQKRGLSCTIICKYWQSAITDSMPNWYVAADAMRPKNLTFTEGEDLNFVASFVRREQYIRYPTDGWKPFTAEERFDRNQAMTVSGMPEKRIIPTPVENLLQSQSVTIDSSWVIVNLTDYISEIQLISDLLTIQVAAAKPASKYIEIITDNSMTVLNNQETQDEAYIISINPNNIAITVRKPSGVFYAYQSLRSLLTTNKALPVGDIKDQPRFQYRGMHVDVGRNFHTKEEILKILDAMAMYKLNKFHFHLTEDEGWRLEIPGLPELTEVGSKRCHDPMEEECLLPQLGSGSNGCKLGCGFYTVEDYKEILRYANARHIEVIPEIDMPGHCRAGIKAMEARYRKYMNYGNETAAREFLLTDFADKTQYLSVQLFTDNAINICMDSSKVFIRYIIRAIKKMHADIQPLKVYHFGGDEIAGAWKDSPECQTLVANSALKDVGELKKYFAHLMTQLTNDEALVVAAWGDGLKEGLTPFNRSEFPGQRDVIAYNWENVWEWGQGDKAYKLANAGYKVVLGHATHLYFDHPYEPDPEERGFYWATRFTDTRKVFGYVPSDIYKNADIAGNGQPLTQDQICTNNGTCLQLERPENIIGMQGHIWTETVRTAEQLQEMVFPRLIALAERAWHKSAWEDEENKNRRIVQTNEEWTSFAKALVNKELDRLEGMGIKYNIPKPGGRLNNLKVEVNAALPGLNIQYTEKGRSNWRDVTSDTKILPGTDIELRTTSKSGRVRTFGRTPVTLRSPLLTSASNRTYHGIVHIIITLTSLVCILYA